MPTHKTTFISDGDANGLDNTKIHGLLKGLAIDSARQKFNQASPSVVTDSTTGTVGTAIVSAKAVTAPFKTDGVATTGVTKSNYDTSMGKFGNAAASLANYINPFLGQLGHDAIVIPAALTITAAVPALDKTATGVATTGAVDFTTGLAEYNKQLNNFATVAHGVNKIAKALGYTPYVDGSQGVSNRIANATTKIYYQTLVANVATAASVDGSLASTLKKADLDTAMTALANDYATLIDFINRVLVTAEATVLTDSTGGTASTALPPALVALVIPPAFTTAATDCAPKAGFDTQLAIFRNAVASIAATVNKQIDFLGADAKITKLSDLTVGSISTTLAAEAATLAAVTGTTVCIDKVTATTTLQAYMNNQATLASKLNQLGAYYSMTPLLDSTTGVANVDDKTLVAMATTATGNDGTANATMAATAMNTFLAAARNNVATLAAYVNALVADIEGKSQPLTVVVGL